MNEMPECEYRHNGRCELIALHGRCDPAEATVAPDACRACMNEGDPNPDRPNYVIASLAIGILRKQRSSRQVRRKMASLMQYLRTDQPQPREAGPCRHRGDVIGSLACRTCTGGGHRTMRACGIHGRCTDRSMTPKDPKEKRPHACYGCDEFEAEEESEESPGNSCEDRPGGTDCVHRGPIAESPGLYACERLGRCRVDRHESNGVASCHDCEFRRPHKPPSIGPDAGHPRIVDYSGANPARGFLVDRMGRNADCLRDAYAGEPCILACGGPSLANVPVDDLQQRGILLAAVNNAATVIRPHLWFSVDQQCHFHESIWRDPGIKKFAARCFSHGKIATRRDGRWVFSETMANQCPNVFFYKRRFGINPDTFLTESPPTWGGKYTLDNGRERECKSVFLLSLRMLYWLGIRTVYLVGCDFNMQAGRSYGFDERKERGGAGTNNTSYGIMRHWLAELRPAFEAAGFNVYNCTPGSKLTAFGFRDLNDAIEDCTATMPQKIVTRGQYGFA